MPDGNRTDMSGGGQESSPQEKRERVQLFLAKYHGFTTAVVDDTIIPTRLAGSIGAAHPGISVAHGRVQDSLNSGQYDQTLAESSLAGAQFDPKERGYLHNMNRYYAAKRNYPTNTDERAKWAARALRWGNIIVGSIASELDKVKGVEFIKEGGEVLLNAVEEFIARADSDEESIPPPSAASPPANPDDDDLQQTPGESFDVEEAEYEAPPAEEAATEYAVDQPTSPAARRGGRTQPRAGRSRKSKDQ